MTDPPNDHSDYLNSRHASQSGGRLVFWRIE
jgi:hypothetical protein